MVEMRSNGARLSSNRMQRPELVDPLLSNLPYDSGEPIESPWHAAGGLRS
jgi:hypothetical protein